MSVIVGSRAKLKRPGSVALMVTTRDGRVYNLGIQKSTGVFKRYYRWRQDQNIERYYEDRLKTLSNPKEIQEFTEQTEKIRKQLKEETNG